MEELYNSAFTGAQIDEAVRKVTAGEVVPTSRTVNGKALSANLSISATDVGARPSSWTPTAVEVGARPSSWTPTIADIGAAAANHNHNSLYAVKNTETVAANAAAAAAGKASVSQYSAVFPVAGWTAAAPYTQTVAVAGLLASDAPIADVSLSDTAATAIAQLDAWGRIGRVKANAGSVTATCYEEKPAVELTVRLAVIR